MLTKPGESMRITIFSAHRTRLQPSAAAGVFSCADHSVSTAVAAASRRQAQSLTNQSSRGGDGSGDEPRRISYSPEIDVRRSTGRRKVRSHAPPVVVFAMSAFAGTPVQLRSGSSLSSFPRISAGYDRATAAASRCDPYGIAPLKLRPYRPAHGLRRSALAGQTESLHQCGNTATYGYRGRQRLLAISPAGPWSATVSPGLPGIRRRTRRSRRQHHVSGSAAMCGLCGSSRRGRIAHQHLVSLFSHLPTASVLLQASLRGQALQALSCVRCECS